MLDLTLAEVLTRTAAAILLGAAIGAEREFDGKPAGLRTHLLLAVGAALFGMISVGAFGDLVAPQASTNVTIDPGRIASYVAAGIGFLGAGAIIQNAWGVEGLTTAASLWATAAVGLAAGLGFWSGAIIVTAVVVASLWLLRPLRGVLARVGRGPRPLLVLQVRPGASLAALVNALYADHDIDDADLRVEVDASAGASLTARLPRGHRDAHMRLVDEIAARPEVTSAALVRG